MPVKLVVLAAITALTFAQQPADPTWPVQFSQYFTEVSVLTSTNNMTGTMYYDAANNRERIDRDNGRWDRYCGLNGLKQYQNTPCSHYVVNGDRYLHYPEMNECCYCCSSQHGCGIVKHTWLAGAEYLGTDEHGGLQTYKWNQKGLQDNFYWETIAANPEDRRMVALYQEPDDLQDFPANWTIGVDEDLFTLPSICSKTTLCAAVSTCTSVRNMTSSLIIA